MSEPRNRRRWAWERWVAPWITFAVMVTLWQLAVSVFDLPKIILPSPLEVARVFVDQRQEILDATWVTFLEIITAYAFSIVLAVGLAVLFSQSRLLRLSIYPYAIFLKTLPIIAIAPIVVIWMGEGFWAVVVVAWIVAFLPILTNTIEGLLSVPRNLIDLMKLYGANRLQILLKLQLPHSLPYVLVGCKISSVSCVLGAVVAEIFVGYLNQPGIGYRIFTEKDINVPGMYAYIIVSGLIGISLFALTSWIGNRIVYWKDPLADDAGHAD